VQEAIGLSTRLTAANCWSWSFGSVTGGKSIGHLRRYQVSEGARAVTVPPTSMVSTARLTRCNIHGEMAERLLARQRGPVHAGQAADSKSAVLRF